MKKKKKIWSSRKEKLESKRHLPFYLFYSSFGVASSPKVKTNLWPLRRVLLYNVLGTSRPNFFLAQIKSSWKTLPPQTYLREEWSKLRVRIPRLEDRQKSLLFIPPAARAGVPWGLAALATDPGPATASAPCPGLCSASADDVWGRLKGELALSWTLEASLGGTASAGKCKAGEWPNLPDLELCALPSGAVGGLQPV